MCVQDPWYNFKHENKFQAGSEADVEHQIKSAGLYKIAVSFDGHLRINHRGQNTKLTPVQAVCYLVKECGLREGAAEALINKAKAEKTAEAFVKYATMGPTFNVPSASYDDMYRTQVQLPYNVAERIPSNVRSREPAPIDDATFRQATRAAETGQKDIFDVSVLSGLARTGRMDEHLTEFTKDIIVGNDRIGRIMFLFYWHFDKFADKYGDEDMSELEDLLREVFKQNGDLILFLKKKSVEAEDVATGSVIRL
jgi:hypothetical protein